MAVSAKPKAKPPVETVVELDPTAFINGAGNPPAPAPEPVAEEPKKKPKDKKERVVLHFDADILERLDREAGRRHISRGAMVRQLIAEHVPE